MINKSRYDFFFILSEGSSILYKPKFSSLLSGLGIFKNASTSPTAGINSGINGFNSVWIVKSYGIKSAIYLKIDFVSSSKLNWSSS